MQVDGDSQPAIDEFVTRAQEGSAAAIACLYEHFSDRIYRYVSFKTGNPVEAEDITADVFVRMLESIGSFKRQGYPFSSWLYRIAHNLVVDHFRRKGRKKTVPLEQVSDPTTSWAEDPDRRLEVDLAMREVRVAMEELTDLQLEVISLRFAAGLSVAEAARAVRKNENAVKALQHAGLKKLRRVLIQAPKPSQSAAISAGDWGVSDGPRV